MQSVYRPLKFNGVLFKVKLIVMKKNSLTGSLLLAIVITVLFTACQKEQSTTATETDAVAAGSENSTIVRVAGTGGSYPGSINPTYAAALAANYSRKFGDDDDFTKYVAFSAKDLVAFINNLQTKYKSDIIYVNFGVYGRGAQAVNYRDNGRLTVFFTGNKIPAPASGRKSDGLLDDVLDEFLNHGQIFP